MGKEAEEPNIMMEISKNEDGLKIVIDGQLVSISWSYLMPC